MPREREGRAGPSRLPFGRSASAANAANSDSNNACPSSARAKRLGEEDASVNAPQATPAGSDAPSALFAGLRFLLRGETDTANVRSTIENAGGFITTSSSGLLGALSGPGSSFSTQTKYCYSGSALYFAEHNGAARERYRTECWLERCLFVDRVCAPDEHASFVKRRRTE
ncbi:hypothetical protein B0H13DRAFT_2405663 [Mycena leptocephala]|nr:hypothetical protein B0H13DRAFT_2405663 [Mycena leptocephala]